jgi:hypothetical protein
VKTKDINKQTDSQCRVVGGLHVVVCRGGFSYKNIRSAANHASALGTNEGSADRWSIRGGRDGFELAG